MTSWWECLISSKKLLHKLSAKHKNNIQNEKTVLIRNDNTEEHAMWYKKKLNWTLNSRKTADEQKIEVLQDEKEATTRKLQKVGNSLKRNEQYIIEL